MKPSHIARPITLSPEVIAKCDAADQGENFDRVFRSVITVPKAAVEKGRGQVETEKRKG